MNRLFGLLVESLDFWPCGNSTTMMNFLIPQWVWYRSVFQGWFIIEYGSGEIVWKCDLLSDHVKKYRGVWCVFIATPFYMLDRSKCAICITNYMDFIQLISLFFFSLFSCLLASFKTNRWVWAKSNLIWAHRKGTILYVTGVSVISVIFFNVS